MFAPRPHYPFSRPCYAFDEADYWQHRQRLLEEQERQEYLEYVQLQRRQAELERKHRAIEHLRRQQAYETAVRQQEYEQAVRQQAHERAVMQELARRRALAAQLQGPPAPARQSRIQLERATIVIQRTFRAHLAARPAHAEIDRIADDYQRLSSFKLPNPYSCVRSAEGASYAARLAVADGKLAFVAANVPLREHEEALTRLLTRLDSVDSHGDKRVRDHRRQLVKDIERDLEQVEAVKNAAVAAAAQETAVEHGQVPIEAGAEQHGEASTREDDVEQEADVDGAAAADEEKTDSVIDIDGAQSASSVTRPRSDSLQSLSSTSTEGYDIVDRAL